jgi:hypothetical protein
LVRGEDRYVHYELETPPGAGAEAAAIAAHDRGVELYCAKEADLGKNTVARLD